MNEMTEEEFDRFLRECWKYSRPNTVLLHVPRHVERAYYAILRTRGILSGLAKRARRRWRGRLAGGLREQILLDVDVDLAIRDFVRLTAGSR